MNDKTKFKYGFNLNARDIANEEQIMQAFMDHLGNIFTHEKLTEAIAGIPGRIPDYQISKNGNVIGFAEVKRRDLTLEKMKFYGGLFLSKKKYMTLRDYIQVESRCVYVVGLDDVIGYHSINDDKIIKEFIGGGGKTNRNSPNDFEPMMVFDPDQFKVIKHRELEHPK